MKKYYDNTVVGDIELNIYTGNYAKALYLAEKYIEESSRVHYALNYMIDHHT